MLVENKAKLEGAERAVKEEREKMERAMQQQVEREKELERMKIENERQVYLKSVVTVDMMCSYFYSLAVRQEMMQLTTSKPQCKRGTFPVTGV